MSRICVKGYKCIACNKNFTKETEYSEHFTRTNVCTIKGTPVSHSNYSIDYLDKLVSMVNDLTVRVDRLEKENAELKRKSVMKNSEKTINELLETQPSPSISFKEWVELILSDVPTHLEVVFNDSLLAGMNSVLKTTLENIPILAFKKKSNAFYYYDDDQGWVLLETSEFDKILGRISYRFLVAFNKDWYQPNIGNIQASEEYKSMYNSYYMKILGGTRMSDESRFNRVRYAFYNLIKQ